jgi:putative transposase
MLNEAELSAWYARLHISPRTRSVIDQVRSSEPARRVGGGRQNVSGRYPSRKMGFTIQFESHRVELAGIYEMEHDDSVLEFYDQPPTIKLDYLSREGRRLGVMHTPDFFLIRQDTAGWEEWKTEEELVRLVEKNPNRYCRAGDGQWHANPGEEYATAQGLYYRVRSSQEIDWVFQRNIRFLEDYFALDAEPSSAIAERVKAYVGATPGISLQELVETAKDFATPDDIYKLIASDHLWVDLRAVPMAEPDRVPVFPKAPGDLLQREGKPPALITSTPACSLNVGSALQWDGRIWKIVNVGKEAVSLLGSDQVLTELPLRAIETLAREGRITEVKADPDSELHASISDRLSKASEADLLEGNKRFASVSRFLRGEGQSPEHPVSPRTLRRWIAAYRSAEHALGCGYLGLLPRTTQRGNRAHKLPENVRVLMTELIEKDYETLKQKTKTASWLALSLACDREAVAVPSYKTFSLAIRRRPRFTQVLKRSGRRAAYQHEAFHWELELTTPRHGDRPFEIAHIDHTELDVECVCSLTGRVLGRPWMTLLSDAFSRRILAFYLTFDRPSYRSCMMVLRESVRRQARLPQVVVVDGGGEFQSTYFETLLARYECTKKTRPPAKARFGSVCERLFGTTNTQFLYNLQGNTQLTRNVRQVTKAVDPKRLAVWSFKELHARLAEYLYEIYDSRDHPALSQTPREAYEAGLAQSGQRLHRIIPYDRQFLIHTLPAPRLETAKVVPGCGIKVRYLYYWCDLFRDPQIEKTHVAVRYDPFDAGSAFAFVQNQWAECHSEYYAVFRDRSEREVMLASQELRKRRQNHAQRFSMTARKLAEFLQSVEAEEKLLLQRLGDQEVRRACPASCVSSANTPEGRLNEPSERNDHPEQKVGVVAEPVQCRETYGEL